MAGVLYEAAQQSFHVQAGHLQVWMCGLRVESRAMSLGSVCNIEETCRLRMSVCCYNIVFKEPRKRKNGCIVTHFRLWIEPKRKKGREYRVASATSYDTQTKSHIIEKNPTVNASESSVTIYRTSKYFHGHCLP